MIKTKKYDFEYYKRIGDKLLSIKPIVKISVKSQYVRNGKINFDKIDKEIKSVKLTFPEKDCVSIFRKLRKANLNIYSVNVEVNGEKCEYRGDSITDIKW